MKSALLIIDMQNGFLDEYAETQSISEASEVINYCSDLMRKAGQVVVHIRDVEDAGEMTEQQLATTDLITIEPGDLHLEKEYSNAFFETELAQMLKAQDVGFLILAGQAAEHCVVFTYNGAIEQGFTPTVLQEGVVSRQASRVLALMEDRNVCSHAVISSLIAGEQ